MRVTESAKIFLPNRRGHILAVRRVPGDINGGEWDLVGGGIDPDESPLQAARRELGEEGGLWHPPSAFLFLSTREGPSRSRPGYKTRYHYFLGNIAAVGERGITLLEPDPNIQLSHEHDAYRWEPPEVLQELMPHPRTQEVLGHLIMSHLVHDLRLSVA